MSATYSTIRYETTPDRVATITLDRPHALNAFDRQMCEEIRSAWQRIKADPSVNAVVLRAAGDRAFCAGLDVKKEYGQPEDVWNHEDPGELLSPKWQKVWKPVVCAVQGMCTAGAFYFVNEADIVICSTDATFFDSHVTYGMVSALEPVGLMRRIGLGETLRIALSGNDERVSAETALRIGLVTEVVARDELWPRAHEIAAGNREQADRGHTGDGARDLGVARPSVSRRDGAGADLHAARQPDRQGRGGALAAAATTAEDPLMRDAANALGERIAAVLALDPAAPAIEFERRWRRWGELGGHRRVRGRRTCRSRARASASCCATGRPRSRSCSARCAPARASSRSTRSAASSAPVARSLSLALPCVAGEPDDLERLVEPRGSLEHAVRARRRRRGRDDAAARTIRRRRAGVAVQMLTSGTTGPAEAHRPRVRDAAPRPGRREALRVQPRRGPAPARRRGGRQLAARPPGRPVPRPAVRQRRALVRAPRALHGRRLGGCRPAPPAGDGEPRARRAAHGARGRRRSRRPAQRPLGDLGHRTAVAGRRRCVHGQVRNSRARRVRRDRVRRRRRGLEPGRPPAVLVREARQRRSRASGLFAARRRPRRRPRARSPTRKAFSR